VQYLLFPRALSICASRERARWAVVSDRDIKVTSKTQWPGIGIGVDFKVDRQAAPSRKSVLREAKFAELTVGGFGSPLRSEIPRPVSSRASSLGGAGYDPLDEVRQRSAGNNEAFALRSCYRRHPTAGPISSTKQADARQFLLRTRAQQDFSFLSPGETLLSQFAIAPPRARPLPKLVLDRGIAGEGFGGFEESVNGVARLCHFRAGHGGHSIARLRSPRTLFQT